MLRTSKQRFTAVITLGGIIIATIFTLAIHEKGDSWITDSLAAFGLMGALTLIIAVGVAILEWADRGEKK